MWRVSMSFYRRGGNPSGPLTSFQNQIIVAVTSRLHIPEDVPSLGWRRLNCAVFLPDYG